MTWPPPDNLLIKPDYPPIGILLMINFIFNQQLFIYPNMLRGINIKELGWLDQARNCAACITAAQLIVFLCRLPMMIDLVLYFFSWSKT